MKNSRTLLVGIVVLFGAFLVMTSATTASAGTFENTATHDAHEGIWAVDAGAVPIAVLGNGKAKGHEKGLGKVRPLMACGTLTGLPEGDDLLGTWTVELHDGDAQAFEVTADTKITPPDVEPELDQMVCFRGHDSDDGWVADQVRLSMAQGPEHRETRQRKVVIRGTVVGEPANDPDNDWLLNVAVVGGDEQSILITSDTRIEGEIAESSVVVVHALPDASGQLVAIAVVVVHRMQLPDHPGRGPGRGGEPGRPADPPGPAAVHFEGTVTDVEVGDDGETWTIESDDETVQVLVTDDTALVGFGDEGPLDETVEGVAVADEDGDLVARMIRVK